MAHFVVRASPPVSGHGRDGHGTFRGTGVPARVRAWPRWPWHISWHGRPRPCPGMAGTAMAHFVVRASPPVSGHGQDGHGTFRGTGVPPVSGHGRDGHGTFRGTGVPARVRAWPRWPWHISWHGRPRPCPGMAGTAMAHFVVRASPPVSGHGQDGHGTFRGTGVPRVSGHGRDGHGTFRGTGVPPVSGHGQDGHGTRTAFKL
jgi:hypothetical protein